MTIRANMTSPPAKSVCWIFLLSSSFESVFFGTVVGNIVTVVSKSWTNWAFSPSYVHIWSIESGRRIPSHNYVVIYPLESRYFSTVSPVRNVLRPQNWLPEVDSREVLQEAKKKARSLQEALLRPFLSYSERCVFYTSRDHISHTLGE